MRISGGLAKGIPLRITKTDILRPATESNRERIFSSLGELIIGKKVLDLFAGSGSYGLEALSRGASEVHFVEKNRKIFQDLKFNFEKVRKSGSLTTQKATFSNCDVLNFLKREEKNYDLVFLDPPYSEIPTLAKKTFDLLTTNQFVHRDSILIHEAPPDEKLIFDHWKMVRTLGKKKKGAPSYQLYMPEL
jgi:16S rRNA (guanine966-N2)-methyltransferase